MDRKIVVVHDDIPMVEKWERMDAFDFFRNQQELTSEVR